MRCAVARRVRIADERSTTEFSARRPAPVGVPDDYRDKMARWVATTTPTLGKTTGAPEQVEKREVVRLDMRENFAREISKRRAKTTEDFISSLVTARDEDEQLLDEEMGGVT